MNMNAFLPIYLFFQLFSQALANTEKTIFLAPHQSISASTDLATLCLPVLSPAGTVFHTHLSVPAVSKEAPHERRSGSWYILHQLNVGQRYEVRVCWAATVSPQPLYTPLDNVT